MTSSSAWRLLAFALLTLADAAILHLLSPIGPGVDWLPALVIAGFGNLVLVGLAAPWLSRALERRRAREQLPGSVLASERQAARNRAAILVLAAGTAGLLVAGLAVRPVIVSPTDESERSARLVREHVLAHANEDVRRNLDAASTVRVRPGVFRTCIPEAERRSVYCLLADTRTEPPRVVEDQSSRPNPG